MSGGQLEANLPGSPCPATLPVSDVAIKIQPESDVTQYGRTEEDFLDMVFMREGEEETTSAGQCRGGGGSQWPQWQTPAGQNQWQKLENILADALEKSGLTEQVKYLREHIAAKIIIDFPFRDINGLHLSEADALFERSWVYEIKGAGGKIRLILHGHTFLSWNERTRHRAKDRANYLTSANWRLAVQTSTSAWEQDASGAPVLPRNRDLKVNWRSYYRQASKREEIEWNWRRDDWPRKEGGDLNNLQMYNKIKILLLLADGMEVAETFSKRQTNRKIRGGNGEIAREIEEYFLKENFSTQSAGNAVLESIQPSPGIATLEPSRPNKSGVAVNLTHPEAQSFWEENFPGEESVTWAELHFALKEDFADVIEGIDNIKYGLSDLRKRLDVNGNDTIKLTHLNMFTKKNGVRGALQNFYESLKQNPDASVAAAGARAPAAMDQRALPDVVFALQQMGFDRDACVEAAVACHNDVQASSEWLLAKGGERAPPAPVASHVKEETGDDPPYGPKNEIRRHKYYRIVYETDERSVGSNVKSPNVFRVLFVGANNRPNAELDLETEVSEMEKEFRKMYGNDLWNKASRFDKFKFADYDRMKEEIGKQKPHVLHVSCHGEMGKLELLGNELDVEKLSEILRVQTTDKEDNRCQIIILNACHSDETAYKLWAKLKYSVSVVGHTGPVFDVAAVRFSENFYNSLGELNSFEDAFKAGASEAGNAAPSTKYVLYATRHAMNFKLQKPKSAEEIQIEEDKQRLQQKLEKEQAVGMEQRNTQAARQQLQVTEQERQQADELLHQQLWGKRFESSINERDICHHCGKHRNNHHFAAPGHPDFCNSLDGVSYEKNPNSNAPTFGCCGVLDSVFGLGAPCKNCLRPKHKHFPAAQGGSTIKVCESLDLYTSCKPNHIDIPFTVFCGPSVCCACPVPEYWGKWLMDEMTREQNLQQSGWGWVSSGWYGTGCSFRTFIVLFGGSILFGTVVGFIAILVTLVNASKDQSSSASDQSFQIVILSSVPIMMLVAIGYRWVQWKSEKQILQKFLSEEGNRQLQREQTTLRRRQAQQVNVKRIIGFHPINLLHHHAC
jgi:hypothetical protein